MIYSVCDSAAETYYELLEERVCQFFAELLLRPAGKVSYNWNEVNTYHLLPCLFYHPLSTPLVSSHLLCLFCTLLLHPLVHLSRLYGFLATVCTRRHGDIPGTAKGQCIVQTQGFLYTYPSMYSDGRGLIQRGG